jgi:RNA polymerase sigma-70 factor (ECF subfamily)
MEKRLNHLMTEVVLSVKCARDIDEEFRVLVRDFRGKALALAYRYVNDKNAAADIAQEAFLKAHRALPQFRGDSMLSTWFFAILIREAKRYNKRQKRKEQILNIFALKSKVDLHIVPKQEGNLERHDLQQEILKALQHLSINQRDVVILIYMQGMSVDETAKVLEKASGTIKSHLNRALQKLREELKHTREVV